MIYPQTVHLTASVSVASERSGVWGATSTLVPQEHSCQCLVPSDCQVAEVAECNSKLDSIVTFVVDTVKSVEVAALFAKSPSPVFAQPVK